MIKSAQLILLCLVSCLLASAGTAGMKKAEPEKIQHAYIAEAVDELLLGKQVSIPKTDSFGCAIFYRKINP